MPPPSPIGRAVLVALASAICLAVPARAQDGAGGVGRPATAAAVPGACKPEIARFCPELDATSPPARTAAICLKPFKTSLSLPCRKAVRGVFP